LNAFPQLKQFFKKQKAFALNNGYIVTDNISGRRIYLDDYKEFKKLEKKFTSEYWQTYREEKAKDSTYFRNKLKPMVREYFMKKGSYERNALNYPIQGESASITKYACILVYEEIVKRDQLFDVLFPNVIHDEILLEASDDEIDEWADIVQQSMEKAGEPFCKTVKLKAEPEIMKKWRK